MSTESPTQRPPRAEPEARFAPLETKLLAPSLRPGLVVRRRLVNRLQASTAAPVVCVIAPAGYGKTTLLAQWDEADARPFAWVSPDASDNDSLELLTYVAIAINRLEPLGGQVFSALSARDPQVEAVVLPRLGKAVAKLEQPFVLVLDDAHVLSSSLALDAVGVLIAHLPAGSQVVLASRSEPGLALGRLRAERALVELGPADLAFDRKAADALLRASGVRLSRDHLRVITERTEGWPAGLYLAALSLKAERAVVAPVEGFRGDDRAVADYFGEQVLARLPLGVARFLVQTSILGRLSGPLCDAVLESSGSAAKLQRLGRSNLFLIPLDRRRVWYRYHTLFAEMLRRRLHDEEPGLEIELHRRASVWYTEHGEADEAVRHAVEAHDVELAGDLVWAHVNAYLARGRRATLQRWLAAFTDEQVAGYPPLALAAAWCAVDGEEAGAVERWTSAAAQGSFEGPLSDGGASVESAVALLRAMSARDGVERMGEDAARVRELEPESSRWRASGCFLEGAALRLTGDVETARLRFEEGKRIADSLGIAKVGALCLAQLALLAISEDAWERAASLIGRAKSEMREHRLAESPTMKSIITTSALIAAHRGELDEARRELLHARQLMAGTTQVFPWFEIEGRLILARTDLLLADGVAARLRLGEARDLMKLTPNVGLVRDDLEELTVLVEALPAAGLMGPSALTTAEVRLLYFLPTHLSFREIGERMHLSRNTVKTQAVSVYRYPE